MTRIIIFSDLHANWEALLALQQAEPRPDAILCLGDLVGYGPDAKRCLDAVRAGATHLIGGRHDRAVGLPAGDSPGDADEDRWQESMWAYTRSILPAADRDYLAALPAQLTVELAGTRFHLTRFAPEDADVETRLLITTPQARLQAQFASVDADIILLGGSHIPAMRQVGKKLILSPGSLGRPRYGVTDPTFAAWQDGRVQIHHLHYHPHETARKLALLPLDPDYIARLQAVLESGGLS